MRTNDSNSDTPMLGETVAEACDMGGLISSDPAIAAEVAGRHLERVLVRACNARLAAALAALALEFTPEMSHVDISGPAVRSPQQGRRSPSADRANMTRAA